MFVSVLCVCVCMLYVCSTCMCDCEAVNVPSERVCLLAVGCLLLLLLLLLHQELRMVGWTDVCIVCMHWMDVRVMSCIVQNPLSVHPNSPTSLLAHAPLATNTASTSTC